MDTYPHVIPISQNWNVHFRRNSEGRYRNWYVIQGADGRRYLSPTGRTLKYIDVAERILLQEMLEQGEPVEIERLIRYPDLIKKYGAGK